MRVFLFLLSLLISASAVALTYFGFTQALSMIEYMIASTALSVILAFICGHFMYRAWVNRRRFKESEALTAALEEEKRELAATRTRLEAELSEKNIYARPMPSPDIDPEITQKIMMTPPPESVLKNDTESINNN